MLLNHALRLTSFAILSGLLCPASSSAASNHARTKTEKKQSRGFAMLETKKKARKRVKMSKKARAIHQTLTNTRFPAIKMEDVPIKDVLDIVRQLLQRRGSTINIIPMLGSADSSLYRQKMSQCVSLFLQDTSVADLLTQACVQARLKYTIVNQGVIISIPKDGVAGYSIPVDDAQAKVDDARIQAIRQALVDTRIPSLDMENEPLGAFIDHMRATLRSNGKVVNFVPLPGNTEGKKYSDLTSQRVSLKLNDVSVDDVLTLVGMQLGIKHTIMPQGVAISSAGDTP